MKQLIASESAWLRALWLGFLIAAGAGLSAVFTGITPFAAFAVIAVLGGSWRGALALTVLLWLANQALGYGVLHYPWTANGFGWGLAIGAAAVIGT